MSDELFKTQPLLAIHRKLTDIEADVIAERMNIIALRKANRATLSRVRALQDLIRPTLGGET